MLNGYEASFGSYDVDETTHTLTHHVQGSITRDLLVGKELPRNFEFTAGGQLIIRSARAGRTLVGHMGALLTRPRCVNHPPPLPQENK